MAGALTWNDNWLLGIESLDTDHREMAQLINRLAEADERTTSADRLDDLIARLRAHFEREERFLEVIQYPRRDAHRREHRMHLAEFVDLRRRLPADQNEALDPASLSEIKDWFFNHVLTEDCHFAAYYHEIVGGDGAYGQPWDRHETGD